MQNSEVLSLKRFPCRYKFIRIFYASISSACELFLMKSHEELIWSFSQYMCINISELYLFRMSFKSKLQVVIDFIRFYGRGYRNLNWGGGDLIACLFSSSNYITKILHQNTKITLIQCTCPQCHILSIVVYQLYSYTRNEIQKNCLKKIGSVLENNVLKSDKKIKSI